MTPERAMAYRKQAAALLEAVLDEEITPRCALNTWPSVGNADPSVQCAYTMLWYFEADEERHHVETFYSDVQIKTIRDVAILLKEGKALTSDILNVYKNRLGPQEYQPKTVWQEPVEGAMRVWRYTASLLESHHWFRR